MIRANDREYDLNKPPVMLPVRVAAFTCEVCHRPGMGPPNARVHPGECRRERVRQISQRSAARRKRMAQC